jgi:hypothetical protein
MGMCVSVGFTRSASANEFFFEAKATVGGKPIAIKCARAAGVAKREFSNNFFPSPANKFRSYQMACMQNGVFAGASFKIPSSVNPVGVTVPPFNGTGPDKTTENAPMWCTVRVAGADGKQVQIHSFMNSEERNVRQHFTGTPELKITEWKQDVTGSGKKRSVTHTVGGTLTAAFESKVIKGKDRGEAGEVTVTFRDQFKEVLDPGAPLPAFPAGQ